MSAIKISSIKRVNKEKKNKKKKEKKANLLNHLFQILDFHKKRRFLQYMWPNPQFPADFVIFTEKKP